MIQFIEETLLYILLLMAQVEDLGFLQGKTDSSILQFFEDLILLFKFLRK